MREFVREPEALFWALIFPVLLAGGLGIAFRAQGPETVRVAAVTPQLAAALSSSSALEVVTMDGSRAAEALRAGRILLVVDSATDGSVVFRYDDTNAEARTARLLANHALQESAGRTDPVTVADDPSREPGSRYI